MYIKKLRPEQDSNPCPLPLRYRTGALLYQLNILPCSSTIDITIDYDLRCFQINFRRICKTLNKSHPSIDFTIELEENGRLPFLGMDVIRNGCRLDTTVYRKPTDKGLLLHYHSHVDARYKRSLLNTMLNRAFQFSSTWKFFHEECERLKEIFSRLRYPTSFPGSPILPPGASEERR